MPARAEEDHLLFGAFDLNGMGLDVGIVLECLMNDAAVVGVHRFEFEDVAPTADLLGAFLGALDELLARLTAVPADIQDDAGRGFITAVDDPVEEVLKVPEGGTLPSNEAARVVGLHIEHQLALEVQFLDLGVIEAEVVEHLEEGFLRCEGAHGFESGAWVGWVEARRGWVWINGGRGEGWWARQGLDRKASWW